jgi:hypothetical protein
MGMPFVCMVVNGISGDDRLDYAAPVARRRFAATSELGRAVTFTTHVDEP